MAIRASSGDLYISQIRTSPQAENIVYTWCLADGKKAYLVLNKDKLECHFVNDNGNIVINEIDQPPTFTQDELISFLLESHPILSENRIITFIENEEKLHTWHLADKQKIHLIRNSDKIEYVIINDKKSIRTRMDIPYGTSIEEFIEKTLELCPVVYADSSIEFIEKEGEIDAGELDGCKAYIIRNNGSFEYQFTCDKESSIQSMPMPDYCMPEEYINSLLESNPTHEDSSNEERPVIFTPETPFREILSGEKAFYNQSNYVKSGKQDWSSNKSLPVSYTWNTEHKVIRIAKKILSAFIFSSAVYTLLSLLIGKVSLKQPLPVLILSMGIYKLLQIIVGKIILPASSPMITKVSKNDLDNARSKISLKGTWKYKRILIEADGYKMDSVIIGKPSTFNNGRWYLTSNGNGEFYEGKLFSGECRQVLHNLKSNALVFNYPGVGSSSGSASKKAMVKAYRAMLTFLEDKERGIGAKEIIGYGFSIGGAIQGEALKTHPLKKDIKYVFIKDRTFSALSQLVSEMMGRFLGFSVKCLGWEMDSVTSSKKLQVPEIILQTTKKDHFHQLESIDDLQETDLVIEKKGSLAFELLKEGVHKNKHYLGITSNHRTSLDKATIEHLSGIVNQTLIGDVKIKTS